MIGCLFTMASEDWFFAGYCNDVVCGSESSSTPLPEIKNMNVGKTCFLTAETILEVMLLKADLVFQYAFNLDTAFVCNSS